MTRESALKVADDILGLMSDSLRTPSRDQIANVILAGHARPFPASNWEMLKLAKKHARHGE
jgi:hypothetical protein